MNQVVDFDNSNSDHRCNVPLLERADIVWTCISCNEINYLGNVIVVGRFPVTMYSVDVYFGQCFTNGRLLFSEICSNRLRLAHSFSQYCGIQREQ